MNAALKKTAGANRKNVTAEQKTASRKKNRLSASIIAFLKMRPRSEYCFPVRIALPNL